MAPQVQFQIYNSVVAPGSPPALGTSYSLADVHAHDFSSFNLNPTAPFRGWVQSIHVKLTDIVTAASVTIRVCLDAAGDFTLIPDTTATISTGLTVTDSGCTAYSVDIPIFGAPENTYTLYLFAKVNAGSANWEASIITVRA